MKSLRPVIKFHDEKWSVREWIISKFPEGYENMTYVEPYAGGINILLAKNKSCREIISDMDKQITNLYKALRDEPSELVRRASLYKHSPETFEKIEKKKIYEDYLDEAVHELMLRKMSRNGQKKNYLKMTNQKTWREGLNALHMNADRIKEVFIFEKPALEVIKAFDSKETLIYCDPPYLHDTNKAMYESEDNVDEHIKLHKILNDFDGKVVLSGCLSPLYKRLYKNWNMSKNRINNTKEKRTEILWTNF